MEENGHDQVQSPHLVSLSEAVDSSHLPLLVRGGEDAARSHLRRDRLEEILSVLRSNVFAKLGQKLRGPFSLYLREFVV